MSSSLSLEHDKRGNKAKTSFCRRQ
uniref:Uncharacterized protein n=1 Tax=Rhizophora mucronata TaxID=61149 RepID=A0A2P2P614_RHIMU